MATTEQLPPSPGLPSSDEQHERDFARKLAERYRLSFIDLKEQRIDPELFRTIPADLMFRYNFVPLEVQNNVLSIAVADPSVQMSDELPLLLGKKLAIRVATARQIGDLLKRTEQSQRVLEQATEAFALQTSKEEQEEGEETISADRLTRDTAVSPVVRLVE